MPDVTPTTPPAETEKKPRGPYARNDSRIAAYLTEAGRFLRTARTDAEIQPVAAAHGFDAAAFTHGDALVSAAGSAWGVRLEGMGEEDAAVGDSAAKLHAAREAYLAFRTIGRAIFPDAAAQTALGVTGRLPEGFNTLLTQARASYANAGRPPYAEKFALRGYPAATLAARIAEIDALLAAEADQTEAEGAAIGDTEKRDAAYADLKEFMAEFRGTLKGALRGQPALRAKLGL